MTTTPFPAQAPATMLSYASAYGEQPIPFAPEYVHLLNQAGDYRSGTRLLRTSGFWDLIWGVPLLLVGAVLAAAMPFLAGAAAASFGPYTGFILLAIGAAMTGTGIWLIAAPSPRAMLVDGISLILLGILNISWFTWDWRKAPSAEDRPSYFWLILFFLAIVGGISRFWRYKRFAAASQARPPRATLEWLDQLRKSLRTSARRYRPDATGAAFRFDSTNAWPPVICKGRLTPELAMCLINSDMVQFYRRSDLRVEPVVSGSEGFIAPADTNQKITVKVWLAERTFKASMPYESFARLEAWQQQPGSTEAPAHLPASA